MSEKKNKLAKPKPGPPTQQYLDIQEIRDDMVILKDGTIRSVLLVSSINFALKSADEQGAIIQAYMSFLNSLEYEIQVVIQSRRMKIDGYMDALAAQQKKTDNDLLRAQIADYRNFVHELVELGEIMQKTFYVIIPYDPLSDKQRNFFQKLGTALSPSASTKLSEKSLKKMKEQLDRRVGSVAGQLQSMSLQAVRLDTQGLIELYYNVYNPDIFDSQPLIDLNQIRTE